MSAVTNSRNQNITAIETGSLAAPPFNKKPLNGALSSATKALVFTGKLLLMATVITGLAAVRIFCSLVKGVFPIIFVAVWIATETAISTFLGLCYLAGAVSIVVPLIIFSAASARKIVNN